MFMAGKAKPDIEGLKPEGEIRFFDTYKNDNGNYDNPITLLDGNLKEQNGNGYGGVLLYSNYNYIEFELFQKSNIYAYGGEYSDSTGSTPQSIIIYKKNKNGEYEIYKENIDTQINKWYLLIENIPKGIYKIETKKCYVLFNEWYIENLVFFLLKQNKKYYSINNAYYKDGQYQELDITNPSNEDFQNKGFKNIKEILNEVTEKKINIISTREIEDGKLFEFNLNNDFIKLKEIE